ncbi:MAG: hypothetical protein ABIP55_13615 [Tepidisphaeraceae bacterium]
MTRAGALILAALTIVFSAIAVEPGKPDWSSPKAAAKSLFVAISEGNRDAVRAGFYAGDDAQRLLADAMVDLIINGKKLGDAARVKFGASADPIARGMLDPADLGKLDAATVKETGDAATLDVPGQTRPMSFRKQDGNWRLVVTDFAGAAPANIANQTKLVRLMAAAIDEAATDVAAGKFKTVEAATTAIQQRLHAAMLASYRPATTRATTQGREDDKVTR